MNLVHAMRSTLFVVCLLSVSRAHEDDHSQSERKLRNRNIFDNDEIVSSVDEPSVGGDGMNDDYDDDEHNDFECGTANPTFDEIADFNKLVSEYQQGSRGDFRTNVTVPICFHVIMSTWGHGALTDELLQLQVDALNVAYSSSSCCDDRLSWCETGTCSSETGFRFEMRNDCITRSVNNVWYRAGYISGSADATMKKTLRVGGPDVLNVYYRNLGRDAGVTTPSWWTGERLWRDGIDMSNTVIVGGIRPKKGGGGTLAHEVGHWLGLFHTFEGGCSRSDGVMDTNPERGPSRGCLVGRDTCPGGDIGTGRDPIHNFMDYSSDFCRFEFTSDQIDVMHVSYAVYRAERVIRDILTLANGVISEPLTLAKGEMQVYSYEGETVGASVICVVSYMDEFTGTPCTSDCFNGDADLYLRWGAEPTRSKYDRVCIGAGSYSRCTSAPDSDDTTLYVGVYASVTFLEVTTICSEIDNLTPLADNITSAPVSLEEDAIQIFYLPVFWPLANVTCSSNGDNGNADLFLRMEDIPDIVNGLYDCSSSDDGSDEECNLADLSKGTVFVSILATSSLSNLTVTCYEVSNIATITLENGVASDRLSLSGGEGQYYNYPLEFPDATGNVKCTTEVDENIGNADLFTKWNDPPMFDGSFDCVSLRSRSTESCEVEVPSGASSLYILIFASIGPFIDLRVTCLETPTTIMPSLSPTQTAGPSVTPAPTSEYGATVLRNGVRSDFLSLPSGGEQYYIYPSEFPDSMSRVICTGDGTNGDADVLVKWGEPPLRGGSYDCSSLDEESNERCIVDVPYGASSLYILVYAVGSFTGLRIICTERVNVPIVLESGVSSGFLSLSTNDEQYYLYDLESSDTITSVTCSTVGSNGDADLYLRWYDLPAFGEPLDCATSISGANVNCTVDAPFGVPRLNILVYAWDSFTNLTVTCTDMPGVNACSRWLQWCRVNEECCSGSCREQRCRLFATGL